MNPPTSILLVEDDENDVTFLKRAFGKVEMTVPLQVVGNGRLAIDYLGGTGRFSDRTKHPAPTHLLLDLKLPEKSGFEVLQWIRGVPALKDLRVAILTSSSEGPDLQRAKELEADCYLVKPMSFAGLLDVAKAIDEWVRLGRTPSADALHPQRNPESVR
ncbi:MAG TPA: response regulator [Planctomycetota bacterium]|jgi:CheY-like chemotaxis protein|nr:response regulator [Planctomycetota bacterium]